MFDPDDDWMPRPNLPPATERVAVLVPTMGRPQNAEPFMGSLAATTPMARGVAIIEKGDNANEDAWRAAGADVVMTETGVRSFARKINAVFPSTTEPWVFLVGDDVRFHARWFDHAINMANLRYASVVGTNDLSRKATTDYSPHLLIRRTYIESVGASWDGPGLICHEGYRHNYVDTEIVAAAHERGVWAGTLEAIVEHLHPAWGKSDTDDVYRIGDQFAEQDGRLFNARWKQFMEPPT
jgi:hypothetical protein